MIYTIYNPTTGQILHTIQGDNTEWMETNLKDKSYVEGTVDAQQFYIQDGQPVSKPNDPSTTTNKYNFNWTTKQWDYNTDLSANSIRKLRSQELEKVDKINPVWYDSLTAEQKTELQQYRQALLDIPQQSGFPETVVWPPKPAWL